MMKDYVIDDGITQSILSDWIACRRRAQFILEGWASPAPREAMTAGALWHWILEKCYTKLKDGRPIPKFRELRTEWLKTEGAQIADHTQAERHLAIMEALYDPYWSFWIEDAQRKWIAVEHQFDVEFSGFRLRGKRDGLFEGKNGEVWLMEHKLTARIDENTLNDTLHYNFQNLFYVLATEIELGRPVAGVMYNVVEKPGFRFDTKMNPTLNAWIANATEMVRANPEKYFKRFEVSYPRERVESFKEELIMKLYAFSGWLSDKRWTWRNEQACVSRWNCEFIQACASDSMAGYTQTREMFSELERR